MNTLNMMVTITNRNLVPKFMEFYKDNKIHVMLVTLGRGTAGNEVWDYLGLESPEKAVLVSIVTTQLWTELKKGLEKKLQIDIPGNGIAFTVPLASIGGRRELLFLTEDQNFEKGEESTLKETSQELLIVIANQGYSELIMNAARSVGAAGGTVIHAKGTGMEGAEKFLGVSLASEKEMIFIVSDTDRKQAIMQAIMKEAGMESKAKSIVFSLPVTSTAGLRLLEED